MHHDAIVIGGSFAGLSAAIQIARARRSVCVIDTGNPRNRSRRRLMASSHRTVTSPAPSLALRAPNYSATRLCTPSPGRRAPPAP